MIDISVEAESAPPAADKKISKSAKSKVPISSPVDDNKADKATTVLPSPVETAIAPPTTPKKKRNKKEKINAVSVPPTPIEETSLVPNFSEAPPAITEPKLDEPETPPASHPVLSTAPQIQDATPKTIAVELPGIQSEVVPPTTQVHPHLVDTEAYPLQLEPRVLESVATEPALEVGPEPTLEAASAFEPVPESIPVAAAELVPVPLPEPASEAAPVVVEQQEMSVPILPEAPSAPPRSAVASPVPRAALPIIPEGSTPTKSKKSTKKSRGGKTPVLPRMPELSAPSPIRPATENFAPAETTVPLSSSPVSEPTSQSSQDAGSFEQDLSRAAKRNGSVSSITSIDTDSPPAVGPEKAKVRPAMPPLISIPIAPSIPGVGLHHNSSPNQGVQEEAEREEARSPPPEESPSAAKEVSAKPDSAVQSSTSVFSRLRWFGFGLSTSPATEKPTEKPIEAPVAPTLPTPSQEDSREQDMPLRSTPEPKRTITSPVPLISPQSPAVEKTEWSRLPQRPAAITAIPVLSPSHRATPKRNSRALSPPPDPQQATMPSRAPSVSAVPPLMPVPMSALMPPTPVTPSTQPKIIAPRAIHHHNRISSSGSSSPQAPTQSKDNLTNGEEKERPPKRLSIAARTLSPSSHAPSPVFQSPRSSEDCLPAYSPLTPNLNGGSDSKPVLRSILKQRSIVTPPAAETPVLSLSGISSPIPRLEFTVSRDVPIHDDWEHASAVRRDILASTTSRPPPQELSPAPIVETLTPAPTPTISRSRTVADGYKRTRSKHSLKELAPTSNKVNRTRTPSPSRGARPASKPMTTPPKPSLVPVLSDKIIRTKAPKPAKISTAVVRSPGNTYAQPLSSPILLTSENYEARHFENTVYQYDGA